MGQLAKLLAASKVSRPSSGKNRKSQSRRAGANSTLRSVSVPARVAYNLTNDRGVSTHTERGYELLQNISIGAGTAVGTFWSFPLNPLHESYAGTRLQQLALNFIKFRFRRLMLRFGNVASTSTSGALVFGFMDNPDYSVTVVNSTRVISALSGSVTGPLWQPIDCHAKIVDRAAWYYLDEDSDEVMKTTQGQFLLALVAAATLATDQGFPLYIDYDIEFSGAAVQSVDPVKAVLHLPVCNVEAIPSLPGRATCRAVVPGTVPNLTAAGVGVPVALGADFSIVSTGGVALVVTYITMAGPSGPDYFDVYFYSGLKQALGNEFIPVSLTAAQPQFPAQDAYIIQSN